VARFYDPRRIFHHILNVDVKYG